MTTPLGGTLMVMAWVSLTAPHPFRAMTVMTLVPGVFQAKVTVSLRPSVYVTGDCPVACQT